MHSGGSHDWHWMIFCSLHLISETVGVISLGTAVGNSKFGLAQTLWNCLDPARPENSTILSGPRAVLNDDEGGLCLWPPGV